MISSSPTDVQPVFDTIAESARLSWAGRPTCDVFRRDGDRLAACRSSRPDPYRALSAISPSRSITRNGQWPGDAEKDRLSTSRTSRPMRREFP